MKLYYAGMVLLILVSCMSLRTGSVGETASGGPADLNHVKAHIEFLASDDLMGREATTEGARLASLYLAAELRKYGVASLNTDGTYFLPFDLNVIKFDDSSSTTLLDGAGNPTKTFRSRTDFVGTTRHYNRLDTTVSMVFVGYGITADEYNYDDYDSVDVAGKIVVFFSGEPKSKDTTFFKGEKRTSYSSSRRKLATAKKNGALGVMTSSWGEKRWGWERVVKYVDRGGLQLPGAESAPRMPYTSLKEETLKALFEFSDYAYDQVTEIGEKGGSLPTFDFKTKVHIDWGFKENDVIQARNVAGVFEGTDGDLKHEYVVIGAHYDHEGVRESGVYNGADDNASGTSAVLEVARKLSQNRKNKRSVIVMFFAAEEKGLLGSKYFTQNFEQMDNVIGHINLDMIGRGPVDSIYSVGSDKFSNAFHELVETANESSVNMHFNYHFNRPNDPERLFYRSDHYNFAKLDIPVVFFFDNMTEDYHKITDDAHKINFEKVAKIAELSYQTVILISNHEGRFEKDGVVSAK